MNKLSIAFLLCGLLALGSFVGCKKDAEAVLNCLGEEIYVSLHATPDAANTKLITFEARYSGHYTLSKVEWDFGDGATVVTQGGTTTHTYATAGTYTYKAKITIVSGKSECSYTPVKTITVQ